ncbi:DNA-binding response OmpR family regulator [Bacillus ectoiniformans]|uniref:response regulator transcription factor n=1 Tax=Bacillus ectoiniformans TaxID=1494429 RepID=UPI00195E8737|nr:response regulator transcription factor [Bacillus ectoiniformans]MBM7650486.1 DNA-binding response OmpR family regulator [Bacillus ectoiniformans]
MPTILIVDDETRMLNLLELYLEPKGYDCLKVSGGYDAILALKKERIDLVLLDVMMPEIDGWKTCMKIREFSNVPIIMLTARSDKEDVINGLDVGADDYITKPFDEDILAARVHALLRRQESQNQEQNNAIVRGEFRLSTEAYSLEYKDLSLSLTLKEFLLLETLMKHPERVYTREQLLSIAWDINASTDIRTVDSHIRNLRDKLKRVNIPIEKHLTTVWGIGYQWKI